MPSRRATLFGAANVLAGATIGSGAFGNVLGSPDADFRVVADVKSPPGIKLLPGRPNEAYVETDANGEVVAIHLTEPNGPGISKGADTRFENLVEIHEEPPGPPVDEVYFEFIVSDEGLGPEDPSTSEIASALYVAAADADVPGDGSTNYLQATDVGDAHNDLLSPNQFVPFGVGVDLAPPGIEDLPDPHRYGLDLRITAAHRSSGPPGGGGGGPP